MYLNSLAKIKYKKITALLKKKEREHAWRITLWLHIIFCYIYDSSIVYGNHLMLFHELLLLPDMDCTKGVQLKYFLYSVFCI